MLFKGVLVSAAGPAPNYDMQRILATRSPREAALMSGAVSLVLFFPRYFMVAGITVLALVFLGPGDRQERRRLRADVAARDPALRTGRVVGLAHRRPARGVHVDVRRHDQRRRGVFVNDVCKRYFWPNAAQKSYVRISYAASLLVVLLGCGFGLLATSINEITVWLVSALWGGYAAPNLLKWHWWRMNGHGYFWGMLAGIAGALVVAALPSLSPLQSFPILFLISLAGSIAGSLLTAPEDEAVVLEFYRRTRPWGVWGPMRDKLPPQERDAGTLTPQPLRDGFNILVGTAWQTSLVALPIYIVIQSWSAACVTAAVALCTTAILKFNWYDGLSSESASVEPPRLLAGSALDGASPVPPANP